MLPVYQLPTARQAWFSFRPPRRADVNRPLPTHMQYIRSSHQEAHFRHHLLRVSEHLDTCDRLLSRIDQVDTEVASMLNKWKKRGGGWKKSAGREPKVVGQAGAYHLTYTPLGRVEELDGCVVELEHATRLLHHPGESLVLQTDFLYMVERVDICIEFLKFHRNYKEAEVYLLRFQKWMTRAMTLIKMYFVGSLTQDVSRRLLEQVPVFGGEYVTTFSKH
ncbi:hypothetical protein BGW80DRAFT_1462176 [Lactifluus volemus]|nr:hypothetical protein BGW80DRAFT_1462176 [Lactifluus volemus]